MPFHDLNVLHTNSSTELSQIITFLSELGYGSIAISLNVAGKLPPTPPKLDLPTSIPKNLRVLTRLTMTVSDPSQNHRVSSLQPLYDLVALRPTTEKALSLCCNSLECDIISIDFSQRLSFILRFSTISAALQRGIRFEICYGVGITGGSEARRNLLSGATALIRATRGRGIIISSEARNALSCRGPWDVINLAQMWGLGQERGKEAICEETAKVVRLAGVKRTSYRGVIDVIDGIGQVNKEQEQEAAQPVSEISKEPARGEKVVANGMKRKASSTSINATPVQAPVEDKPLSKREIKRRAKKARMKGKDVTKADGDGDGEGKENGFNIKHETLTKKKE